MKQNAGFTVIELIVLVVVLFAASTLFFYQTTQVQASARDDKRKTDINTIYHNLEKVYYAKNKAYPKEVNETTLPAVTPDTFKDPNGLTINHVGDDGESTYRYEPTGCGETLCTGYVLRADLEKEDDYKKESTKHD